MSILAFQTVGGNQNLDPSLTALIEGSAPWPVASTAQSRKRQTLVAIE
jgi:hypothetical protein